MKEKSLNLAVRALHVLDCQENAKQVCVLSYCIDDKVKKMEDLFDKRLFTFQTQKHTKGWDSVQLGPQGLACYCAYNGYDPRFLAWSIAVYACRKEPLAVNGGLENLMAKESLEEFEAAMEPLFSLSGSGALWMGGAAKMTQIAGKAFGLEERHCLFCIQDYYDSRKDSKSSSTISNAVHSNERVRVQYSLRYVS